MRKNPQLGAIILALAGFAALGGVARAQASHADRPPQAQNRPAPPRAQNQNRPQSQNRPANRPQGNANRPANKNQAGNNRPAQPAQRNPNDPNRPANNAQGAGMVRRPPAENSSPRPWVDTMRDLTPGQRERVLQNSRAFQSLSPDKQARIRQQFKQWDSLSATDKGRLRENENTWRHLTPEQRDHIKNDVVPKWRQMPWDRQQVMKQKLGVLQNMPESARNQRLNDPNFTKGMSDDEKSMLHDLSHMHVGAPPDSPNE